MVLDLVDFLAAFICMVLFWKSGSPGVQFKRALSTGAEAGRIGVLGRKG